MKLTREQEGILIIITEAILWSFFPIITLLIYQYISPLFTLALGNLFAIFFFGIIIVFRKKWHEFKNKSGIKDVFIASIFISLLWIFVFIGLQKTTAGNASIILLMEILFSFLYFGILHKEKFTISHILGATIMIIGAMFILFPGKIELKSGDLIILIGTMFPPIGNYFQQKARKKLSAETLLFSRNLISLPIIFLLAYFLKEPIPTLIKLQNAILLLVINGFFMFGISKILWIEGIHRISISKAISFNTISPAFTLIFAYFLLNEIPTPWQLLGFLPILIGGILITKK